MAMTNKQRAVQLWSVLALAARNNQLLSYTTVGELVGLPPYGMRSPLGKIAQYCKDEGLPKLTDIVVSEEKGLPMYMAEGEHLRALASQAHVFVYDWLKRPPKEEHFHKDWIGLAPFATSEE